MTVAFIPAIGHQKRTTTQKVIPKKPRGGLLIMTHSLATEPAKMNFLESSLKYYFRREIILADFLEKISIKNIQYPRR